MQSYLLSVFALFLSVAVIADNTVIHIADKAVIVNQQHSQQLQPSIAGCRA
jgi:hypothetical protein